ARPGAAAGGGAAARGERGACGSAARPPPRARSRARARDQLRPRRDLPGVPRVGRRANRVTGALVVTRQRIWIAAGVAAAVLAVVLVLALTGGTRSVEVPQQAVTGQTNLSRSGTLFADPLRASVQVLVDRQRVDPSRIGFTTRFDPY